MSMERKLRKMLPKGQFRNVSATQSNRMRSIRAKGNRSTELKARAALIRSGIRGWSMHPDGIPGRPDFVFLQLKIVIFVDGCYWHGCKQCSHKPAKNERYWTAKIQGNCNRDRRNNRFLRRAGYRVMRVWEHELLKGCRGRWLMRLLALLTSIKPNSRSEL